SRLTLETALCAFKGWATRRRRYPNVYVDEFYYKIRDAEKVWGPRFEVLWEARKRDLPDWLRLEDTPNDPGIVEEKSLHFQRTGQPVNLSRIYRDMPSDFDDRVELGLFGRRVDSWPAPFTYSAEPGPGSRPSRPSSSNRGTSDRWRSSTRSRSSEGRDVRR